MGLEVFDHMMNHHPLPGIMVGALTEEGAGVMLQALARGAVDFIEFGIVIWHWGRPLRRTV
jgi:chemotaxis response regulator CheB